MGLVKDYIFKAGGKIFCCNLRYNTNLYYIKEQAEWHVKGSRFDTQFEQILYCIFFICYV